MSFEARRGERDVARLMANSSRRVELLLGSDIGLWVASTLANPSAHIVTTLDPEIRELAVARGFEVRGEPQGGWRLLSVHYPIILSREVLHRYEGAWNLHPSYLPWGRGHFPLVWAILVGEPAGATLHRMTDRVDSGPIVDQIQVKVTDSDTAGQLHGRIRAAERTLFRRWWPSLSRGSPIAEREQPPGGSYHDKAAFSRLLGTDPAALDRAGEARLRRALDFPGKPGLRSRL